MTLSGVVPDLDGLGIVGEIATRNSSNPVYWWTEYHHVLFHNIGFGLAIAVVVALSASRRTCTTLLAVLAFHLHLAGDVLGSRGPEGYPWPIPYLLPFSNRWQWTWEGQWTLNSWQNITLTVVLLGVALFLAWKRGYSPLGIASSRADTTFVNTLRKRFGEPRG